MEADPTSLAWVPIGPQHAEDILTLTRAIEENDGVPYRTSFDEVLGSFDSAYIWRAMAVWSADGLIAYGLARMPANHGEEAEVTLSGGVHPRFRNRGLGRRLLDIQLALAEEMVQGEVSAAGAIMHVDNQHQYLVDLLRRASFSLHRSYVQMRRSLSDPIEEAELPSFVTIEPLTDDLMDDVRHAHNSIYYELAKMPPRSPEEWRSQRPNMEASWSFVAMDRRGDRPRVAGYLLSSRYEQDWEALGWSEGYVDEVAVYSQWREKGIMTALLRAAMRAYQNDGMEFAGMDADVDPHAVDPNGAVESYEYFGFEQVGYTHVMYRSLQIREAPRRD